MRLHDFRKLCSLQFEWHYKLFQIYDLFLQQLLLHFRLFDLAIESDLYKRPAFPVNRIQEFSGEVRPFFLGIFYSEGDLNSSSH
ncbi:hypothetical protein D3C71_1707810 [compost metagenome]